MLYPLRLIILSLLLIVSDSLNAQDRVTGRNYSSRSEVIAQKGMVCSSQPLASQVGLQILKDGGNAIDAAIA
ncbi:MAG: gamma-glutamyltransferase, partial [Saprospiraceae bacterium]|nr:gamma-glutamyltransferase [Saprospiraceae bacterium]